VLADTRVIGEAGRVEYLDMYSVPYARLLAHLPSKLSIEEVQVSIVPFLSLEYPNPSHLPKSPLRSRLILFHPGTQGRHTHECVATLQVLENTRYAWSVRKLLAKINLKDAWPNLSLLPSVRARNLVLSLLHRLRHCGHLPL